MYRAGTKPRIEGQEIDYDETKIPTPRIKLGKVIVGFWDLYVIHAKI